MERIYFDYAATSPTDPEVLKAMEPYFFAKFGNASSPHTIGREAAKALEDARASLSSFIGASAQEIVFTSGATESNNQTIIGIAESYRDKGGHIIISAIEHHSVFEPAAALTKEGFRITCLNVDETGLIDLQHLKQAIKKETILIAVMHASNEIGTIQPIDEVGKIAREHDIVFLVDAVQSVGHIPVNVKDMGADLLSLSAHKFYGPKGVGALYIRDGVKLPPLLLGGDQERSRRASTQNVAGAVGLGKAVELCRARMKTEAETQAKLRDKLLQEVPKLIEGVKVNGHLKERLPNNAHFSFERLQGESLLMSLDMNGVSASMGSACTSGAMEPSHVLRAIGLTDELAYGSLRITLGRWTTEEQIDYFLEKLPGLVGPLRI